MFFSTLIELLVRVLIFWTIFGAFMGIYQLETIYWVGLTGCLS
jgi:hypothetical protein